MIEERELKGTEAIERAYGGLNRLVGVHRCNSRKVG
jgi:hypothetical protein